MVERPDFLKGGEPARLFPLVADTNREQRIASILLAVMTQVPALAADLLGTVGLRIGVRTKIDAFTEVVLQQNGSGKSRPDGLIVVSTGKARWSALVEAKIGKADLDPEQVQRYIETARDNGIDAVITLSNQFVARADHSPVQMSKVLLRKVNLFHWSWMSIVTACEILEYQQSVEDTEQAFLLREFLRYLNDQRTGVERFAQMGADWKDLTQRVTNGAALKKSDDDIANMIGCWFEEERDLCLQLSRHVGQSVETVIERKFKLEPAARMKASITDLVENLTLTSTYRVPDCAGDIEVAASLRLRTISASMKVKAPLDKKSTKARVNWLMRMLKKDDPRIMVTAHWPGRAAPIQKPLAVLRVDPDAIQTDNPTVVPHSFEVALVNNSGKRFGGRRTFIEDLEAIVPNFYDLVGQNLRAWQPAPPRPVKTKPEDVVDEMAEQAADDSTVSSNQNA